MNVIVRELGLADYVPVWQAMQAFTAVRGESTADEFWCVEHRPVFTLGRAGRREHLLAPADIPIVQCDRGGQVTYHGPGQLVVYTLLDVRRMGLGPRELVRRIERALIACLSVYGITASRRDGAPGVYVGAAKIAALGLRLRGSYSYHGFALNVSMDLEPFHRINPCGYAGLEVTQMSVHGGPRSCVEVQPILLCELAHALYGEGEIAFEYASALSMPAAVAATA